MMRRTLFRFEASGTEGCELTFSDQAFVATWTNLVDDSEPRHPTLVTSPSGQTLSAFGITVISVSIILSSTFMYLHE